MRVMKTFVGKDGRERQLIKVVEDNSVVFIGYKGYAKDFQEKKEKEQ